MSTFEPFRLPYTQRPTVDDLAPAKGIMLGLVLSCALWFIIAGALFVEFWPWM